MRKTSFLLVSLALVSLVGCQTGSRGGAHSRLPPVPDYPPLAATFDTSARLMAYVSGSKYRNQTANFLRKLKEEGYVLCQESNDLDFPDLIVEILSFCVQYGEGTEAADVVGTLKVRVRKPMRTAIGSVPMPEAGEVFKVLASGKVKGKYTLRVEDGAYKYSFPETEKSIFADACANLLNVEGFRRALERK